MTGNRLSDLQPLEITQAIGKIVGEDSSALYLTPDNFGLTVSSDFSYVESESVRFLYGMKDESAKAAQLRFFIEDGDFFVTDISVLPFILLLGSTEISATGRNPGNDRGAAAAICH